MNKIKVRVYHAGYGCDTGCCGHIIELDMGNNDERQHFDFDHPYFKEIPTDEDKKKYARELAENAIKENWPDCYDSIDWDSLDYEDVVDD